MGENSNKCYKNRKYPLQNLLRPMTHEKQLSLMLQAVQKMFIIHEMRTKVKRIREEISKKCSMC